MGKMLCSVLLLVEYAIKGIVVSQLGTHCVRPPVKCVQNNLMTTGKENSAVCIRGCIQKFPD
jgi:hypothetical protein